MDNTNPVARQIHQQVPSTVVINSTFGRALLPDDELRHVSTLIGLGSNPNLASIIVVGLEQHMTERVADGVARTGKDVEALVVQRDGGTIGTIARASRIAERMARDAQSVPREPCSLSELVVGLECGGSDATSGLVGNTVVGLVADRVVQGDGTVVLSEPVEMVGAEHILANRAATPEIADALRRAVLRCEELARASGVDISGTNPSPDNIAGGLTTIEEKALGAIKKAGSSVLQEVVGYGERPSRKGLIVMEGPAPAVENMTGLAAAGANVILFYTGQGNTIGNPVSPTVKLCGNPKTVRIMKGDIDISLTSVLAGKLTLQEAAQSTFEALLAICGGQPTASEVLGQTEIAISRANLGL